MGRINAPLIHDCERARLTGNKAEHARLVKEVEESQERCSHPAEDRHVRMVDIDSRKYKRGGLMQWCMNCSKVLGYTPPGT